jgi:hypothetical protein
MNETHDAKVARLQERNRALAAAANCVWEPETVADGFARSRGSVFTLTMQGWIDLSAMRSPILLEEEPEGGPEEIGRQIDDALKAFGWPVTCVEMERDQIEACVSRMIDAVRLGFGAILPMSDPRAAGGRTSKPGGFGLFSTTLAALIGQLGMSRADALGTPVAQAFVLIAADKWNSGWEVNGISYAQRGVAQGIERTEGT